MKANGYGHGAVPVARPRSTRARRGSGSRASRRACSSARPGIDAPVLLLSEPPAGAADTVVAHGLTPVVYTDSGIDAVAKAVGRPGRTGTAGRSTSRSTPGMHRVGCTPADAVALVEQIAAHDELTLDGVCTHFAVADEPDDPYTQRAARGVRRPCSPSSTPPAPGVRARARGQLGGLARVAVAALRPRARAASRVYGIPPAPEARRPRRPASRDDAHRPRHVREDAPRRRPALVRIALRAARATGRIATVPVGYADGVPRNLGLRRRRGADPGPPPSDRRHRDDGPAHGRRRRRAGRGGRRGRAARARRATTRSPPTSGPSASAPSPTRSSRGIGARVPRSYVG